MCHDKLIFFLNVALNVHVWCEYRITNKQTDIFQIFKYEITPINYLFLVCMH